MQLLTRALSIHLLLTILIGTILSSGLSAQKLDSLKQVWHSETATDSARRLACAYIFTRYKRLDVDSALVYAQAFTDFAREKGWESSVGIGLGEMGNMYEKKGNLPRAIELMEEGLAIRTNLGEEAKLGGQYINLGLAYQRNGRIADAIGAFNRGIQLSRQSGNQQFLANGLNNLGFLYYEQKNYDQAFQHYSEALEIYQEAGYKPGIAAAYVNLATIKQEQHLAKEAIDLFKQGLLLHRELGDSTNVGLDYFNIGVVYDNVLKETASSTLYYNLALQSAKRTGFQAIIIRALLGLARINQANQQPSKAIQQSKESLDIALEAGLLPSAMQASELLSELYAATNQHELALETYQQFTSLRDSIDNEESRQAQIRQEYRYAYEKQAFADSLAYVQNQAEQQVKHQQELAGRNYLIFGLLGLSIITFLFLRYRQQIRIRERELALQQERHRKEQLAELDSMKSRFFANISHEFRTPLTLILGQTDQLQSMVDDPALDAKFHMLDRNGRRLLGLVNQVLDLAKLESAKLQLQPVAMDLIPFLKNMLFSFESLADQKKIRLLFHSELEGYISIVDPEKIERVFFNLISNAIKFTPENGEVVLLLEDHTDQVRIGIQDTGIGIPKDQLAYIFDRFYQANSNEHQPSPGTGIGLALARELVELHHGSLSVESHEGKGSTFWVELPTKDTSSIETTPDYSLQLEPTEVPVAVPNTSPKPVKEQAERILIVEDNPDVRSYLQETLMGFGYQVLSAEHGQRGLSEALNHQPDLIISDVMMPKMDGFSFAKAIREDARSSHIPLILLTAKASEDSRITGLETGIDDYLTKPFNARELEVRIKNLIEQRKRLRQQFSNSLSIKPGEVSAVPMDQAFLETITQTIESNLGNSQFGVDALSAAVNMSVQHLNRKLNALIGQSAGRLIRSMRLQRAADLLEKQTGTISDVSYELGFSDPAQFARAFKKQFGVSPSAYKKS